MRRRPPSFASTLVRCLAAGSIVYAGALALVVPAVVDLERTPPARLGGTARDVGMPVPQPTWTARDARRFPGCGDMALWDGADVPAAVVVVRRDGRRAQMSFDEAVGRVHSRSRGDDVWVVGACR